MHASVRVDGKGFFRPKCPDIVRGSKHESPGPCSLLVAIHEQHCLACQRGICSLCFCVEKCACKLCLLKASSLACTRQPHACTRQTHACARQPHKLQGILSCLNKATTCLHKANPCLRKATTPTRHCSSQICPNAILSRGFYTPLGPCLPSGDASPRSASEPKCRCGVWRKCCRKLDQLHQPTAGGRSDEPDKVRQCSRPHLGSWPGNMTSNTLRVA